jgi:hypothetical protein
MVIPLTVLSVFVVGMMTLTALGVLSDGTRKTLFEAFEIIIALGCLLGVWAAFRAAYRKGLIGKGVVLLSAGLWLILAVCAVGPWLLTHELSEPRFFPPVLLMVLTALPVAPLALAPLALSWNRHR